MNTDVDVVVVGAGPTGLLLAGDLARAGVSCVVLERHAERSNLTRAFAVHARTLEQLDARGVADELVATGTPESTLRFLGTRELRMPRLPSRFPYVLITPQYETERVLADYAERVDTAEVARPTGVVALIRPDAYVAWACEPGPGDDRAALVRDALARWCGASSPAAPGSVGSVIDGLSQTG